jgi:hypothetical protein
MRNAWQKFIRDKNGTPVLWQPPNVPIILWAALGITARFVQHAPWHALLSVTSTMSLIVWALLEIGQGASYFRRTLGSLVLVYIVLSRLFW